MSHRRTGYFTGGVRESELLYAHLFDHHFVQKLMITMGIRATPTFKFFSGGECILTHVGIDETKLRNAILKCQAIRAGTDEPEEAKT